MMLQIRQLWVKGLAYYFSMNIGNIFDRCNCIFLTEKEELVKTRKFLIQKNILPVGTFAIQSDFDTKYVLTNIAFIREVLNRDSLSSSSLEIRCTDADISRIQTDLQEILGEVDVKTPNMSNMLFYIRY